MSRGRRLYLSTYEELQRVVQENTLGVRLVPRESHTLVRLPPLDCEDPSSAGVLLNALQTKE